MFTKKQFSEFVATFFYIGKIKYCPGTFGSIAAFPLTYFLIYFIVNNKIIIPFLSLTLGEAQLVSIFIISFSLCLILLILGTYFTKIYLNYTNSEDPKEVVIDEVVGQMLTIVLVFFSALFANESYLIKYFSPLTINIILLFVLPFCLFRFFDIVKPWPINWLDQNIKGSIGVMLDDLLAAIFAAVTQYAIIFVLIDIRQ
ncbi:phosphatidylglycerophosphatase A family protein [Rickettsia rickettsii]|uniref:Phosphatidylglycerophosphatase A n=2 Tax=Rickettsia rickettsii TaxID=783 RepID=B0BV42_RICRO|nr:phosphatidylglycerophosphatase A [Rickettsia rickettsii]ABV76730.1 phosphatidylglycerophosphatase A [Rickettsia rickettsii str. 'Sheila Smith']ABY73102.1 phosphatidylglycerophosphatase A [Rickettsia rickettsii str. Iowa]AFB21710.1 phosphatidylglycerophosphatase A [Rickettsia rickettsii str. Brazil]AFB24071.1 phosphatidylglycerophosphatase A [Rickettsia rickettsii str. Colombia]AFB25415.1 phosphatidylglycerophosphatase A [Rickettsia rickettsii str. Arizona]